MSDDEYVRKFARNPKFCKHCARVTLPGSAEVLDVFFAWVAALEDHEKAKSDPGDYRQRGGLNVQTGVALYNAESALRELALRDFNGELAAARKKH